MIDMRFVENLATELLMKRGIGFSYLLSMTPTTLLHKLYTQLSISRMLNKMASNVVLPSF